MLLLIISLTSCSAKKTSDTDMESPESEPKITAQDNPTLTDAKLSDAIFTASTDTDANLTENDVEDETLLKPNPREDILISIDPGHQSEKVDMSAQEPVAPSSGETKAKATGGTKGRFTGVPEYQLNLDISLKLRDALTELGYKVIMTREDNETAISNKERAELANDSGADISIRIHANGSEDSSTNGALAMVGSKTNPDVGILYDDSYKLASLVLDEYCKSTGMASQGVVTTDTMTGINWSKVPVMILEMGFMTNQQDDTNMQDPDYQTKMVQGIVKGIEAYYDFDNSGLKKDIENKLSELEAGGAVCSVYIKNLKTDEIIDLTTEKHRAASIIKLFIAGTVYENMNSLMQSGQSQPKLEGLIENMISKSDNDAANNLVRILGDSDAAKGMEKVNSYISSLGFTDSEMGRLMLDFDSGKENYISAIEVGEYLEMLYKGDVKGSDKILGYMKQQERVNKIPAGLPSDITVANKTGELEDVEHDSAIVYGEDTDYIIVILLSQLKDTSSGRQAAVDISSLVYDHWN